MNKKLLAMLMIHLSGAPSRPAPIQRNPPRPDDGLRASAGFPQWLPAIGARGRHPSPSGVAR